MQPKLRPAYRTFAAVLSLTISAAATRADTPPAAGADGTRSAPAKCELAFVSPVTHAAECLKPPGAPVDPPPPPPASDCEEGVFNPATKQVDCTRWFDKDHAPAGGAAAAATFTADGRMELPANYREWIFLSSGLDMTYRDDQAAGHSMFDNVFVDPQAYREFIKSGTWPQGTVLVREDRGATEKGSINKHGKFQTTDLMGIEVHVKDSSRFKGDWAFFIWDNLGSPPAARVPDAAPCYSCHRQHGSVDSTFVQFYPTLNGIAHGASPQSGP